MAWFSPPCPPSTTFAETRSGIETRSSTPTWIRYGLPLLCALFCSRGRTAVVLFVVFGMNDCCDSSKAVAEPESPGRRCSRSRACFDEHGSPMVWWVYLADNNESELRDNGRRGSAAERACKSVVWQREHAERTREKRHGDRVERTGNVCELMFPGWHRRQVFRSSPTTYRVCLTHAS